MTGSPHTNIQRRAQCSSQTLVSFGLDVEFTGSFRKHLVDGAGGRCREGGGGTHLSPEPYRPAHSTPLDTFRSLKARAQSRAKQPSAAQAQNGAGRARKSRLELDGGLARLAVRGMELAGTGHSLPERTPTTAFVTNEV